MRVICRRAALLSAASLSVPLLATRARAQGAWPDRPVTLVNPYPPGGSTDFSTRLIATRMEAELGQSIIVESRPGAGTAVANAAVASARPDGYTLLMGTASLAVVPALQPTSQPRDPVAALTAAGGATRSAFLLHVHPDLPARNTAEIITYCRANPGKVSFGSSGIGAMNHMALELFRSRAGIDVLHVPYRGGAPALLDLQAGRIQAMFAATQEAGPSTEAGKTRALAVTSAGRVASLPQIPPIADALPGFEVLFWQGVFGPAGMPLPVVARIEAAARAATMDETVKARLASQGIAAWTATAEGLRTALVRDLEIWSRVIREGNIRAE